MDYSNPTETSFQYQPIFSQIILFMKQKLFGAASLVAFILFGASCSNQEQSEFNLDSVQQQVTISATVTYSTGVDVNATSYSIVNSKPAAGRKVFIEVPYNQFKTGAEGSKIYETITDANGKFSIAIPTKSEGINNVKVRMEEFTDFYRTYDKMDENGKPVFKTELKKYTFTLNLPILKPNATEFPNEIEYVPVKIDVDQFDESVTLTGQINLAVETAFQKGTFNPANKANVEFSVIYDATTNPLPFTFGTTTDAQGNYSITLPLKSLADGVRIKKIQVLGIGNSKFVHYTSETDTTTIYGAYQLSEFGNTGLAGKDLKNIISGVTYNLGAQNLLFTPFFNDGITNTAQAAPKNWDPDLIGWAAGMGGFDESYDKTITLTGRILMPVLSSYGKAAYIPSSQVINIIGNAPYDNNGNGFTAVTNKDGSFSIQIPAKDDTDPNFAISLKEDVQPFTFIDSKGTSTTYYKGNYQFKTNVTEKEAEWYEFGDVYFKYNVNGDEKTDEWSDHLIGWYVDPEFTDTVRVKGSMMFATETSYGQGVYEARNYLVTVEDQTDPVAANHRQFTILPVNGSFDFDLPVKNKNANLTLQVINATYKTYEYKHYPKFGGSFVLLEGTYTSKPAVYDSKEDKNAWYNLGTRYMFIDEKNLDNLVTDCDTYNQDLYGWYVRTDNNIRMTESTTATGDVKIAQESGYLEGKMNPAKNMLVPVKIANDEVYVLTNNAGKINIRVYFKNQGDEPNLTTPAVNEITNIEDFVHYVDATGKTKILSGKYVGDQVKDTDADWNTFGTIFYTFSPAATNKPADWESYTKYIAEWIYKKDFNLTKEVTGYVKLAQETGYMKGNYKTEAGIAVKIQLDADPDMIFIAKTDAQGKFTIKVPVEKDYDEPDVDVMGLGFVYDDDHGFAYEGFVHYIDEQGKTKELEGKYYGVQIKDDNADWNDAGTIYYTFTPKNAGSVEDWNTYYKYIAGWVYKEGLSQTVSGKVKVARETGYMVGDFNGPANNFRVKIHVDLNGDGLQDNDEVLASLTDAQGNFSIAVPVEDNDEKYDVTILSLGAIQFKDFLHYENAQGKTKNLEGNYSGQQIKDDDAEWTDAGILYYTFNPKNAASVKNWNDFTKYTAGWIFKKGYNTTKNVTGTVKLAQETAYLVGSYKEAKDVPVKVQVDADLIFVAPSGLNGALSIPVIVKDENDEPDVDVLGLGYGVADGFPFEDFTHYVDATGKTKTLTGTYKGEQDKKEFTTWNDAGTLFYKFYPAAANKPDEWDNVFKYIAGWTRKSGFDQTKTVSGVVKKARETSFLVGDFADDVENIAVKVFVSGDAANRTYVVPATSDGTFLVDIDVEDLNDEPTIVVNMPDIHTTSFVDYVNSNNDIKKLEGDFTAQVIKEDGTGWSNLGTVYYTFTPDAPTSFWTTYTQFISGWFCKKGYIHEKTVTGTVKLANETGFWQGGFTGNAKGVPVKVQIPSDGTLYHVGPADVNGQFAISVYLQNSTDEPNVTWVAPDLKLDEDLNNYKFVHYYEPGPNGGKSNINGTFTHAGTVRKDGSKWYQLGTRHYIFSKIGAVQNWTTQLAGWQVWPADYTQKLTVKGAIQKAIEDFPANASATAKWAAAPYALATVTVTVNAVDYTFRVAANDKGMFTINPMYNNTIGPDDLAVSITPDQITETFKHWTDPNDKNTLSYLNYKYVSAGNVDGSTPIDRSGTNTYDLTSKAPYSAKLIYSYSPDPKPTGWDDYTWDVDAQ